MSSFRKATKHRSRLRAAIDGPSGSGKTFTALRFAHALGKRIAVINTESGAVEKYLGLSPDGVPFDFDIVEPPDFSPTRYTQLIVEAGREGYDVLIIDSLSHAWAGQGGALEIKDKKGGNSFTAWKDVTPMQNAMLEAILRSPCHVIATMRSKMEYVLEDEIDQRTGAKKTVPRKIGMAPIQRQGVEYEFDVICDMDHTHMLSVSKSRCPLIDGLTVMKPGAEFMQPVRQWLEEGIELPADFFAVKDSDLKVMQQAEYERNREANEKAAAEAHEADRLRRLAAATGQVSPAPVTEVEKIAANYTLGSAPAEQPPFDGGSVPATAAAATPSGVNSDRVVEVSVPQVPAIATVEQCIELAGLGEIIGRTVEEISEICVEKYGVKPNALPYAEMANVLDAFREAAAEVQQAAGNPTTAA